MNPGSDAGPQAPRPGTGVGGRIRVMAGVSMDAFAVTMAVLLGQRLSDQALAVLAGTVCGVGASIPTSLLIIWVTRRREERATHQQYPAGSYPPVVIVQQPALPGVPQPRPAEFNPYAPPPQREFSVVGGVVEEVLHGNY